VKNPKGLQTVVVGCFPFLCLRDTSNIGVEIDGLVLLYRSTTHKRESLGDGGFHHFSPLYSKKNANVYGVPSSSFGVIRVGVLFGVLFLFCGGILDGKSGIVELLGSYWRASGLQQNLSIKHEMYLANNTRHNAIKPQCS